MKVGILCYSLSGNNERVASAVAERLGLELGKVFEPGVRRMLSTVLDIIFKRIPKVIPAPEVIGGYDLVVLFAPVWIGHIATPIRAYLDYIREKEVRYGLVTVSGGPNPKVKDELIRRTGREPEFFVELSIVDLLPAGVKPTITSVMRYQLSAEDVKALSEKVVAVISPRVAS